MLKRKEADECGDTAAVRGNGGQKSSVIGISTSLGHVGFDLALRNWRAPAMISIRGHIHMMSALGGGPPKPDDSMY